MSKIKVCVLSLSVNDHITAGKVHEAGAGCDRKVVGFHRQIEHQHVR